MIKLNLTQTILNFGIILMSIFILNSSAHAQFIYFNVNTGYAITPYESSSNLGISSNTHHQSFILSPGILYRPIRNLGIGLDVTIPVAQGNSFSFKTQSFNAWTHNSLGNSGRYKPRTVEYDIKHSISFSLYARLFLLKNTRLFVDIKYTNISIQEDLEFERTYKPPTYFSTGNLYENEVPGASFNYSKKHAIHAPGIGVGYFHHLSKFIAFNAQIGADVLLFDDKGFAYFVQYEENKYTTLSSKISSIEVMYSIKIGASYFF
jgi:hypothetical protein